MRERLREESRERKKEGRTEEGRKNFDGKMQGIIIL